MVDVARSADVSLKTVSRFVNGATNIDPVLGERIASAIRALGYTRNMAAASLRPGRTGRIVGLVIEDLGNPFYSALARGVEAEVRAAGYLLLSASSEESGAMFEPLVRRLVEQRVDGLVVVPPRGAGPRLLTGVDALPPVVFVDRPGRLAGADSIVVDDIEGARLGTACLLEAGARRVAFLGGSMTIWTVAQRLAGYRAALDQAGLAIDDDLVVTDLDTSEAAREAVAALLTSRRPPNAIFADNNRVTVGSLLAFRDAGRRLPLVGFDDFETATLVEPPVTVVTGDVAEMGRIAAQRLLLRLAGDGQRARRITLPVRLVRRGSELAGSTQAGG
jgi:LacI family transcriptional regulator